MKAVNLLSVSIRIRGSYWRQPRHNIEREAIFYMFWKEGFVEVPLECSGHFRFHDIDDLEAVKSLVFLNMASLLIKESREVPLRGN